MLAVELGLGLRLLLGFRLLDHMVAAHSAATITLSTQLRASRLRFW